MEQVVLPVRLMKMMGIDILFLTNASGGINRAFHVGDFMMITDQISSFAPSPLIGENVSELGERFPDMTHIYDIELQDLIRTTAQEEDILCQILHKRRVKGDIRNSSSFDDRDNDGKNDTGYNRRRDRVLS